MDINQKFYDDVIISLMEMNDRLVALEEMAAEHVAEHEEAAAEAQYKADILAAMTPLQDSFTKPASKAAFLSGNGVIGAEIENKFKQPAPEEKRYLVPMVWKNTVFEARRLFEIGRPAEAINLILNGFEISGEIG
ncbi:hypothetical protein RYT91_004431 [Salmonella enterica]|nr:hypothetical protein [Salmonella enterica]ELM2684151.1 hypothetical protein [Salmonella enterica]